MSDHIVIYDPFIPYTEKIYMHLSPEHHGEARVFSRHFFREHHRKEVNYGCQKNAGSVRTGARAGE